jgi:hypothetical protein
VSISEKAPQQDLEKGEGDHEAQEKDEKPSLETSDGHIDSG